MTKRFNNSKLNKRLPQMNQSLSINHWSICYKVINSKERLLWWFRTLKRLIRRRKRTWRWMRDWQGWARSSSNKKYLTNSRSWPILLPHQPPIKVNHRKMSCRKTSQLVAVLGKNWKAAWILKINQSNSNQSDSITKVISSSQPVWYLSMNSKLSRS